MYFTPFPVYFQFVVLISTSLSSAAPDDSEESFLGIINHKGRAPIKSRNLLYSPQVYESPLIRELKILQTPTKPKRLDTCPILTGQKQTNAYTHLRSCPSEHLCANCQSSSSSNGSGSSSSIHTIWHQHQKQLQQLKTTHTSSDTNNINSWARVQTTEDGRRHFNANIVGVFSCTNDLEPSNDLTLDIRLAKPAIDLAIQAAKKNYSKYINFRVSYRSTPDICKHQQAGGHAAEEFLTNGATYFVGPSCSGSLSSLGQLASYWRVPMCSTGHLPEIEAYRYKPMTMVQLSLSIQSVGEMFLELFRRYNWHHLVIVTDETHPLHSILRNGLLDFFITTERANSKLAGLHDDMRTGEAGPQESPSSRSSSASTGGASSDRDPQVADYLSSSRKLQQANEKWRRQRYRTPHHQLISDPDAQISQSKSNAHQQTQWSHSSAPYISVPYIKPQGFIYKDSLVSGMGNDGLPTSTLVRQIDYEQTMRDASNHSHIMLLLAPSETVRKLLHAAHKLQMSSGQYVFLAHELFGNIELDPPSKPTDSDDQQQEEKSADHVTQAPRGDATVNGSRLTNEEHSNSYGSGSCPFNLSAFGDRLEIAAIPDNETDRRLQREIYAPLMLISLKIPFSRQFGSFIQEVARLSEKEFNHCIDTNNLRSVYSLGIAALVYDCVMLYAHGVADLVKQNSSTIDGETLFDWTVNRHFFSVLTGNLKVNRAGQRVIDFSLNTFIDETLKFEPRAHFNSIMKQLEFLPNRTTHWEAMRIDPPSSDPRCKIADPFACYYMDSQTMRDALSSGGRFVLGIWLLMGLVLSVALTSSIVGWLIYRKFRIESELLNLWWSIKYEDIIFEDDCEALQDVKRSMSSLAISQDSFAQNSPAPSSQNKLQFNQPSISTSAIPSKIPEVAEVQSIAIGASPPLARGAEIDNTRNVELVTQTLKSLSIHSSSTSSDKHAIGHADSRALCSSSLAQTISMITASQLQASSNSHQTSNNHHYDKTRHRANSISSLTQSVYSNNAPFKSEIQSVAGQSSGLMGLSSNSIGKFSTNTQLNQPIGGIGTTSARKANYQLQTSTGTKYNKQGLKISHVGGVNRSNVGTTSGNTHQDSGRRRQHESHHQKDPSISSQNKNVKLKLGTILNGGPDHQFTTKVGLYKASRVAAKHLNVKNLNINRQLLIELRQVRDLTHENLIKFIGLCPEEPNVAIVSELCTRGNLQDLLQNDTIRLDWSFRYSIINDIVDGLQHLHSSPIQHHGRLKSSNCVIDNRFVVKLTDFGLPTLLAAVELDEQVVNPRHLLWTAPEHLRTKYPLLSGSPKGDIYSLAIIFQEIITRCGPFECEPILCATAQAAGPAGMTSGAVVMTTETPQVRISSSSRQSESNTKQQPRLYQNINQQQQQPLYQPMVMVQHKQRLEPDEIVNLVRMGLSPPFRPYFRPDLVAASNASQQQATEGFNLGDLIALVQGCWQEQPGCRPSITSVKQQIRKTKRGHHLGGSNLMDNLLQRMERYTDNLESLVEQKTAELMEEKKRSEELLYEMLPRFVVDQLRYGHSVKPEAYEAVTICFSDIKDFTGISAQSSPIEVVNLLNQLYTEFDDCIARYDVYKVETIGDAYMVVSGLPVRNGDQHASEIAEMSLALLDLIRDFEIVHLPEKKLELRIGIHSGPCASGVVGTKMFRYCLFGDTVNTASRMESHGEPMKIHISEDTADILASFGTFIIEPRGQVEIKGKGLMFTNWLLGKRDQLSPNYQA